MCDCKICAYNREYEKAVKKNDKKFLMEHLNLFLNVAADLEWTNFRMEKIKLALGNEKIAEIIRR